MTAQRGLVLLGLASLTAGSACGAALLSGTSLRDVGVGLLTGIAVLAGVIALSAAGWWLLDDA